MTDWPIENLGPPVIISPYSDCALGVEYAAISQAAPASVATGTANLVRMFPFRLSEPMVALKLWWYNGATVNGNVDCAIYAEDGTKLINMGSTAQATINVLQEVDITDTVLGRGRFYCGLGSDSTTATFFSNTTSIALAKAFGWAQATITLPLTSNVTLAAYAAAITPVFGVSGRTLVV